MSALFDFRNELIQRNREEYGENYQYLKFLSKDLAEAAAQDRSKLIDELRNKVQFGFKATKIDTTNLSQGCKYCGTGFWSCLFVNGKCNGGCFYCPSEQKSIGIPATNALTFTRPIDYLDYIEKFGFKGVSLSGGEPLLTFDTSLNYVRNIKKKFGDKIYLWLYTNGISLDELKTLKLRDAGLNEIRFDIGAVGYKLDKLKLAVGKIPFITVEIPAIPEDFEMMKIKLREMEECGVNYLNLHQLRLTPYNFKHLVKRNYTFLHGEKVTVLESELTALRLLKYSIENKFDLPINYCSFVYKNRFQKSGARRRAAGYMVKPWENITENGYIRSLSLVGNYEKLAYQENIFKSSGKSQELWYYNEQKGQLYFNSAMLDFLEIQHAELRLNYSDASIRSGITYIYPFREINLDSGKSVFIEKAFATPDLNIPIEEVHLFGNLVNGNQITALPDNKLWFDIERYERVEDDFAPYF